MHKTIFISEKSGGYKESLQRYSDLSTTASDYQKGSSKGAFSHVKDKLILLISKGVVLS